MDRSPIYASQLAPRLLLAVLLLLGAPAGMRVPGDPAREAALAAGALCLGDGPSGLPQDGHRHDHCLVCLGGAPLGGLATLAPVLAWRIGMVVGHETPPPRQFGEAGRAGYRPRGPPLGLG